MEQIPIGDRCIGIAGKNLFWNFYGLLKKKKRHFSSSFARATDCTELNLLHQLKKIIFYYGKFSVLQKCLYFSYI